MNKMEIPVSRMNNFCMIHVLSAILVMYGHMGTLVGLSSAILAGQGVHVLGVKALFVVSGFLVAGSFLRDRNFVRYTIKRVFRIFPPLIVLCLGTVFVVGPLLSRLPLREYLLHPQTRAYLYNILLKPQYALPGVFVDNPLPSTVNGSLWALPAEFACFFLVIPFLLAPKKWRTPLLLFAAAAFEALGICKQIFYPAQTLVFYGNDVFQMVTLLPYFFVGAAFQDDRLKKLLNFQASAVLMLFLCIANINGYILEVLALLILPIFIFSFALIKEPVFATWFAGHDPTYGLFLYAFPIQQCVVWLFGRFGLPWNILFLIALALTEISAVLSERFVERPCDKLCKKLLAKIK